MAFLVQCSYSYRAVNCCKVQCNAVWSIVQCSAFECTHYCPHYPLSLISDVSCVHGLNNTSLYCTLSNVHTERNNLHSTLYCTGQHLHAAPFHPIWCFYCSQTVRSLSNPVFPGHSLSNTLTFGGNKVNSIFTWTRQTKTKPCAHSSHTVLAPIWSWKDSGGLSLCNWNSNGHIAGIGSYDI